MKKSTSMIMLLLFLILLGMHLAPHDAFTLDAPHDVTNSITCNSLCHVSGSPYLSWETKRTRTLTIDLSNAGGTSNGPLNELWNNKSSR